MKDIKRGYEYINLANARHRDVPSMRDFKRALRGYIRDVDDADNTRRIIKSDCDEYRRNGSRSRRLLPRNGIYSDALHGEIIHRLVQDI